MTAIPTNPHRKPRRPVGRRAAWLMTAFAAGALLLVATPDAAFAGDKSDRKRHVREVRGHHDRGADRFHKRDRSDRYHRRGDDHWRGKGRYHHRGRDYDDRHHRKNRYGKHRKHDDKFRFELRIGDRHPRYHRKHVQHRCSCVKRVWVPPVYRTTYDPCGTRRTLKIRPGYYKTVRADHGCAIHHRKGDHHRGHDSGVKIRIGGRF